MPGATLEDVAKHAGLSLATVDRVLHRRGRPRAGTIAKVNAAIDALEYRPNVAAAMLKRGAPLKIGLVLPEISNRFLKEISSLSPDLASEIEVLGGEVQTLHYDPDTKLLAQCLDDLAAGLDALAILAPNDPGIVDTVRRLAKKGVPVATLVADLPTSERAFFVGPNNYDIGATAASLVAPVLQRDDGLALVMKPTTVQEDHEARYVGFCRTLNGMGIPQSRVQSLIVGDEDLPSEICERATEVFGGAGITAAYLTGGSLRAELTALKTPPFNRPVIVGTDLTSHSRNKLLDSELDFVVANDAPDMVRTALMTLLRKLREPYWQPPNGIQPVQIFSRFNLT